MSYAINGNNNMSNNYIEGSSESLVIAEGKQDF